MSTEKKTNTISLEEACSRLNCSADDESNDLDSVIRQGYLTPLRLGDLTRFYRSEVERVAEMFGLGSEEGEAA